MASSINILAVFVCMPASFPKCCFRWGGKHFEYMGKAAPDGTLELCPEEALFLMESSSLGRFKGRIVVP
jgi:hypothetical protein